MIARSGLWGVHDDGEHLVVVGPGGVALRVDVHEPLAALEEAEDTFGHLLDAEYEEREEGDFFVVEVLRCPI